MIDMSPVTRRPRNVFHFAVTLAAGALLLCATPAGAGLSGAIGAGGAGHSLKETLAEATDNFSEMVSAFMKGDDERVSELAGEIKKTPGKLIRRAFPVLEAPHAIAGRLKSARQKIERFAGGVKAGLADARAALATDKDDKSGGWSDAALLEGEPLQAATHTAFAASNLKPRTASPAAPMQQPAQAAANPGDSWDVEAWVIAKQDAKPHCYGVVDPATLPAECFGGAAAGKPAANKADGPPQTGGVDWAADDWDADTGWAGWDKSDPRYREADRTAARVGAFAVRCWGVYEVSRSHGLYDLMQQRMQRNECPNEDTDRAATAGDDGYLTALGDLEEKEAERLRLEEEERERQARLEAEERERQEEARRRRARLDAEEERERQASRARERQRQQEYDLAEQRQQAEYRRQALQNLNESLRGFSEQVNRAYGGGGASGGGIEPGQFDYCKKTPGTQSSPSQCQVLCNPGDRSARC